MTTNHKATTNAVKKAAATKRPTKFQPANRTTATVSADAQQPAPEQPAPEQPEAPPAAVEPTTPAPAGPETHAPVEEEQRVPVEQPRPGNGVAHREPTAPASAPAPPFGIRVPGSMPGMPPGGGRQAPRADIPGAPMPTFAPPSGGIPAFQIRRDTAVLGLRTDKDNCDTWTRNLKIAQGYYNLPDGVIPGIGAQMLMDSFHEIVRHAVLAVHGIDIDAQEDDQNNQA